MSENQKVPYFTIEDKKSKDLKIEVALAGLQEDPDIIFDNDLIKITFDKSEEEEKSDWVYLKKGIKNNSFKISFPVPESLYDFELAKASSKEGILTILIPAKETEKPKKLKIDR